MASRVMHLIGPLASPATPATARIQAYRHEVEREAAADEKTSVRTTVDETCDTESGSDSWIQRDEREVIEHPDEVTKTAPLGLQKAEAAALVWPKWAMYATYAWSDSSHVLRPSPIMLLDADIYGRILLTLGSGSSTSSSLCSAS
jgi:hypothetical protein